MGACGLLRFAAAATLLLAAGCSSHTAPEAIVPRSSAEDGVAGLRLEGTVLDEAFEPIAGADVKVGPVATGTDAAGRFRLEGLPPGEATVEAAKAGYQAASKGIVLVEGQALNLTIVLKGAPVEAAFVDTQVLQGFLACSIGGSIYLDENPCPDALQTGQKEHFKVPFNRTGLDDVLVELAWTSNLPGGSGKVLGDLLLEITQASDRPLLSARGNEYARLESKPDNVLPKGQPLTDPAVFVRVLAAPPNVTPGLAWQQPITCYASFAYQRAFGEKESFVPDGARGPRAPSGKDALDWLE